MNEKTKELLSNAGNICLFVKENCRDGQTARCMSEAIEAINEAVKSEEQSGTPSLREGCEAAMAYLRRVDNLPNDHMRKAFENAYEKVEAALDVSMKSRSSTPDLRRVLEEVEGAIFEDEPGRFCLADAEEILHRVQAALAAPPEPPSNAEELEDLVAAVKELRDGMCQHCDMRDLCAEGEDGISTTCNAMAKVKSFIERHEKHETNDEAPF